jgi:hypothetical protein
MMIEAVINSRRKNRARVNPRALPLVILCLVLLNVAPLGYAYTKPVTYREGFDGIIFQDSYNFSPHGWMIPKAIELIRADGYTNEAAVAEMHLLPMLEGVTFNDVWGDADLAGGSICDYYCPGDPGANFGYGEAGILGIFAYAHSTQDFKGHALYHYGNAAEEAQYRYDYAKRIFLGQWGQDQRDIMAGWVVDKFIGQTDPFEGRWAIGASNINNATAPDGTQSRFGTGITPAMAMLDLFSNCNAQIVFPSQTDPALSTIYVPTKNVIEGHGPGWLDDRFGNADDVEAYQGYDGNGYAVYANWTTDTDGSCPGGGSGCGDAHDGAPMFVRLPVSSPAHAFFQLGWALHLLEDQTTPVHTINDDLTTAEVHNDVERMADLVLTTPVTVNGANLEDLLPAPDLASFATLYTWPPVHCTLNPSTLACVPFGAPPEQCTIQAPDPANYFEQRWYANTLAREANEGVAHAYTRLTAEKTVNYSPYIQCMNTEDSLNYPAMGCFTALGLDLGVKSCAGLIRQFIEDVDKVPPTAAIVAPAATSYPHSATLTLSYSVADDLTGVQPNSVVATLDGMTTLNGHSLVNGLTLNLLTDLALGSHTFTVTAIDYAGNTGSSSVTFSIVVTPASIIDDVQYFLSLGAITQDDATSFLRKLQAAAAYRQAGDCKDAGSTYQAFIHELNALIGKKVTPQAAATMIADAQYLIAHCP